ncbi:class I SAM-dependent methyltransferase [Methanolobus sp. ZRKC3]|uniref:class I SAM-dependent methyltransferase n=1 Tax=Methanolobus sp. ZRKC3 TaxID=3125786 RepID=UPI0032546E41
MKQNEQMIGRVKRTRKQTKNSYDRMSRFYSLFNLFEGKYKRIGIQKLDVRTSESVLEIGFGTGHCLADIARNVGETGKAYGIDISEHMCRTARSTIEKSPGSARAEILCGDAPKLPFKDDSFDAIFMSFVLDLFDTPDIPLVLEECRRALKRGGRICVVALSREGEETSMPDIYGWLHEHFQSVFDCRQIFVRQSLEDAGFQIVDYTEMSLLGLPIDIVLGEKNW